MRNGDPARAERLDIVREVAAVVADLPEVTGVLSAATFFVDDHERSGTRRALRKALMARKLESSLARLDDLRLVHADADGEHWRISARTSMLGDLDVTAHASPAILQTAVICSLSLPVFAASEFAPTRRFAWMLTVLVILALLGDLLVLPALLASPLGKLAESTWSLKRVARS